MIMKKERINVELYYTWKYQSSKENPFDWMINDLWRGVQARSNYLVAIGLFAYSEAIGWVILNEPNNKSWECFEKFTKDYVGYTKITRTDWDDIRNGLAHRYYIKNRIGKVANDGNKSQVGIEIDSKIDIYVNIYFEDFVKGVEKYFDEQKSGTTPAGFSNNFSNFYQGRGFTGPAAPFGK